MATKKKAGGKREGAGRKTSLKLDTRITGELLGCIAGGMTVTQAASYCGVDVQLIRNWITYGRANPETVFGEFERQVEQAKQAPLAQAIKALPVHIKNDPRTARWVIEQLGGEQWKPQARELKVEVKPVYDLSKLTDDELWEMERLAAKASGGSTEE